MTDRTGPTGAKGPDELRRQIEQTRSQLGETVEELAEKMDVKGRARARAVQAERIVRSGLGDSEPADVLAETGSWLARFDRASVVELDYGGIVELVDDEALRNDDSADQVRDALQALREGDKAAAQASYERLREFWAEVAGKQRTC